MIIEIDKTVIDYLKSNKNITCTDPVVIALNTIINSLVLRRHILYSDIETLEYLSEYDLIDELNKIAIAWLIQKYSTIGSFVNNSSIKVIVYYGDKKGFDYFKDGRYNVRIEEFKDLRCTQLMTENDSDARLFVEIANIVNSEVFCFNNISLEYDGRSYSGGNIKRVVEEVTRKFNITLCIVDCDKDYYKASEGSTLKQARSSINKLKSNNIISLYPLKVREKENLLPPILYLRCLNYSNKFIEALSECLNNEELVRFIDLKEGIRAKKCKQNDVNWRDLHNDFLKKCEEKKILNCSLCEKDKICDDFICAKGVNDKGADAVAECFLRNGAEKRYKEMKLKGVPSEKIKIQYENVIISQDILNSLPEYIKDDWLELAKKILDWCCRISDEEMMIYGT